MSVSVSVPTSTERLTMTWHELPDTRTDRWLPLEDEAAHEARDIMRSA